MLAHYLVANVGFKVAPHRFQIAGWWPLIFHPKACCLQSGPYKVALINHNACMAFAPLNENATEHIAREKNAMNGRGRVAGGRPSYYHHHR